MDNTILVALVGAASGLVSGTVASLIAPWINWGVEKRKQKLEYRRQLVVSWRKMIEDVSKQVPEDKSPGDVVFLYQKHSAFHSLKQHLNIESVDMLRNLDPYYELPFKISDEISRIEKKWKLV